MATGGDEEGTSWWGGWIQAAKDKSAVALQQMQKDLSEFTTTIQRDTSTAVASSASVIKDSLKTDPTPCSSTTSKVKEGFSNLLSGISDSLAPKDYGREDSPPVSRKNKQTHIFDRAKARLHAIQTEPGTYCNEPDGPPDHYQAWQETFDLEATKGEISDLLVANTDVRALFTKLVPAAVSHKEFWSRYFYKLHQLDKDEARRAALKERADMTSSQTFTEEDLGWGDDEDESWDTMPDAKHAAEIHQPETAPHTESQSPRKSDHDLSDQAQALDNDSKLTGQSKISDMPSTTPDEQSISREKVADQDDKTRLDMKWDLDTGQSMDRNKKEDSETVDQTAENAADKQTSTISQEVVASDTPNLPPADSVDIHAISQSDLPLDVPGEKQKTVLSSRELGGQGLARELGELSVSTNDAGKDITDKPSPVESEGSSANKELSSLSDDWEKDFDDIEVTEEDIKAAASVVASKEATVDKDDLDDDWENWD